MASVKKFAGEPPKIAGIYPKMILICWKKKKLQICLKCISKNNGRIIG
ncbi:MAG: hypothetical protein QNK28_08415 [Desulfobacterales bacterium]|nr:hypothetical protein [Desulfobacterales bacterium]